MRGLKTRLPDDFSRSVLEGSLRVASDLKNPIRINLFAAGIRELYGHLLHTLGPEDKVRACPWFVQATDTPTVTRRQRAKYATQGGLSDEYVSTLGVDIAHLHRDAIKSIETLNKFTHVRPDRIETDQEVIDVFVDSALKAVGGLLSSFKECRDIVRGALWDHVYDAMMNAFVVNTFDTIDILAGKGYEVDSWIDDPDTEIQDITPNEIKLKFSGVAPITLHYGNKHDAAEVSHDFPFWMEFLAPISSPQDLRLVNSFFDDRGWYE